MEHARVDKAPVIVELPESLQRFAEERVRDGDYADVGAYLLDLLQRDREAQAATRLRELIDQGLQSGPARELSASAWSELRQRALQAGRA